MYRRRPSPKLCYHLVKQMVILFFLFLAQFPPSFGKEGKYSENKITKAERVATLSKLKSDTKQWEQEQVAAAKTTGNAYKVPPLETKEKRLSAYIWTMEYDAPFETGEVFMIIIMPMIIGRIIHYLMKPFRPVLKHVGDVEEFPLVPLAFLQATKAELQMKNEKRNGLHFLASKYIVTASDEYVNKNIGGKQYEAHMKVKKKPWRLVRKVVTLHGWWRRAQKRIEYSKAGLPIPEGLKPIRLQNRPTIFQFLREQEEKRREEAKSTGKEVPANEVKESPGGAQQWSFLNPGESKVAVQIIGTSVVAKKKHGHTGHSNARNKITRK